jgi:hypothetical protein
MNPWERCETCLITRVEGACRLCGGLVKQNDCEHYQPADPCQGHSLEDISRFLDALK